MTGFRNRARIAVSARGAVLPGLTTALVLLVAALQLRFQGRSWWCSCGHWRPWAGDIWTSHNSQHFADPYSFTHVLHGLVLCGVLAWTCARLPEVWRFFVVIVMETAWEIFENTEFVIQRYREATLALGYTGDTIANSLGDVVFCGIGFVFERYLGFRRSVALFLLTDAALLLWIRDSLVLNVVMLIWPVEAIKEWQLGR